MVVNNICERFCFMLLTPDTVCLEEDGAEIIEAGMDVNKAVVRDEDLLVEIEDKKDSW